MSPVAGGGSELKGFWTWAQDQVLLVIGSGKAPSEQVEAVADGLDRTAKAVLGWRFKAQ